jgi:hypothetical protein
LVVVNLSWFVALSLSVTVAPWITEPCVSVTRPDIVVAVAVCVIASVSSETISDSSNEMHARIEVFLMVSASS